MTNLALNTTNSTVFNTTTNTTIKMNSQEIADLVQLRHDNVKRTIETLINSGVIIQPQIEDGIRSANGIVPKLYVFEGEQGKRDTTIIVAQLSPQFLGTVVDRWIELEKAVQQPRLPGSFKEALQFLIEAEEQKEQLAIELKAKEEVIQVMQPTVDAYELIAGKNGSLSFQEAYKFLGGIKLKEMKQWLLDKNWIYIDRHNRVMPSNIYLMNGYLKQKLTQYDPQIRITYKGLAAIARQMKIELNAEDFQ